MFGYLDAGSGSMIVGAVAAGAAGVAVAAKVGWRRMTGAFRKGDGLEHADVDATVADAASGPAAETESATDAG